jgi:hypothetical protein
MPTPITTMSTSNYSMMLSETVPSTISILKHPNLIAIKPGNRKSLPLKDYRDAELNRKSYWHTSLSITQPIHILT